MFYEVRIYDGNGKLKKVVPPDTVNENFWQKSKKGRWPCHRRKKSIKPPSEPTNDKKDKIP